MSYSAAIALRFSTQAIDLGGSIDFVDGADTILHIKPRPDRHLVVLNSYIFGNWGEELHIPLPAEAFSKPLSLVVSGTEEGVSVTVGDREPVEYQADPMRLLRADLRLSPFIEVLPTEDVPRSLTLAGQILAADLAHVRARLRFLDACQLAPSYLRDARLLLYIDGRLVRTHSLLPLPGQVTSQVAEVRFEFGPDVFVGEKMEAQLVLEFLGGEHCLDRRSIENHVIGAIEHCSEVMVSGFAANPILPGCPVMLDVFVGGRFEGTACADKERSDLTLVDPAFKACGFHFRFRNQLLLVPGTDLAVAVRPRDTGIELLNSPWQLSRSVPRDEVLAQMRLYATPLMQSMTQPECKSMHT
ncbi:hypothetical protein [Muricoccus pecuniae]|uniref:Galectin domain-containing protein n=1 Tax=Muricoccus pecuniae TaxID=693023 RepID=A0A840YGQ9_9PROT|nr:hypothetical protein [Roseomonas pecuniae]MBB5693054.1 hypothetical protein [Roseomonas pecuniae]